MGQECTALLNYEVIFHCCLWCLRILDRLCPCNRNLALYLFVFPLSGWRMRCFIFIEAEEEQTSVEHHFRQAHLQFLNSRLTVSLAKAEVVSMHR